PLYAIKQGLLTVEKKGKINAFSGRILEIEGLVDCRKLREYLREPTALTAGVNRLIAEARPAEILLYLFAFETGSVVHQ
ncbi:MAG: hypothetical protein AAF539_12125, partial [Planctomycetota bacterium]